MSGLVMRDVSHTGHELGRATLEDLPPTIRLGDLLRARIRTDVDRYNVEPGWIFEGLVQPADAIRHSDGHHLQAPRPLDADLLVAAGEEAVSAGILWFVVGDEEIRDLTHEVDVEEHDEIVAVLRRPVVARVS